MLDQNNRQQFLDHLAKQLGREPVRKSSLNIIR